MLSRQFARCAQLHITTRWFTRNSIIREINKTDKIPVQKSETVNEKVVGKKRVCIQIETINLVCNEVYSFNNYYLKHYINLQILFFAI